ncbi:hypothetical protein [Marinoscillum furvescens]|uniref:Uncharacterized protein n=1 Tax=Marinoscillum furvescens DSM 4134 TaxID=1122208 RepID=A0A3D9KZV0_MARFU|nr:hypothetical protein [Marinoscillum furvescens]RED94090.1 hypothetical protein C7460_12231 [Marinoscillum furvescens DSM 4134]
MSKTHFEQLLPQLEAMEADRVKQPNMPVDTFLQEAADLEVWMQEDLPKLTAVGLPQRTIDALPVRLGALRHAQSEWTRKRNTKEEAARQWEAQSSEAMDLKNELEHAFRFAFRKHPDLLGKVQEVEAGLGHADLVQDLSDLSLLGKAHQDLLASINFQTEKLDDSAAISENLSKVLAAMNGERLENGEDKTLRDKAFTLLKETVDEIRDAGKYALWKSPERLKGYKSAHWAKF